MRSVYPVAQATLIISGSSAPHKHLDQQWAKKWGAPREDIQNARRIIGEGKGWPERLEAALKKGAISLPVVAAVWAGAQQARPEQQ
ncbi:hypothetical protein [Bradyrhizobium sp. WSM471]|uniref:hypothetical protein n=1 Tax=Bradyrhizobium sp. WSM471 TaxID=319017 RepID=UPI00024D2D9F|nr:MULTISPECIES: hypothetical protein [Bradyrhizobium]EHR03230.1 hypothetical protein Bra471DRAFT_03999 [Bradyrhizobium sp. WSM471]UFW38458.1 hypothetical protein BcanWSM471_19625 [Bradyrhizobium canariense]